MTFEQKLKEMLVSRGMLEQQAEEVIQIVKRKEYNKPMEDRWQDDISGYPTLLVNLMWITTKAAALDYIEEFLPQVWFKPLSMKEDNNAKVKS